MNDDNLKQQILKMSLNYVYNNFMNLPPNNSHKNVFCGLNHKVLVPASEYNNEINKLYLSSYMKYRKECKDINQYFSNNQYNEEYNTKRINNFINNLINDVLKYLETHKDYRFKTHEEFCSEIGAHISEELFKKDCYSELESDTYINEFISDLYSLLLDKINVKKYNNAISNNIIDNIPLFLLFYSNIRIFTTFKDTITFLEKNSGSRFLKWFCIRYFVNLTSVEDHTSSYYKQHIMETLFYNILPYDFTTNKDLAMVEAFEDIFQYLNFPSNIDVDNLSTQSYHQIITEVCKSVDEVIINKEQKTDETNFINDIYDPKNFIDNGYSEYIVSVDKLPLEVKGKFLYNIFSYGTSEDIFNVFIDYITVNYLSMLKDYDNNPMTYNFNNVYVFNKISNTNSNKKAFRDMLSLKIQQYRDNNDLSIYNLLFFYKECSNILYRFDEILYNFPYTSITMLVPSNSKIKIDATYLFADNFYLVIYDTSEKQSEYISGKFDFKEKDENEKQVIYKYECDNIIGYYNPMSKEFTLTSSDKKYDYNIVLCNFEPSLNPLGIVLEEQEEQENNSTTLVGTGKYNIKIILDSKLKVSLDNLPYYMLVKETEELYKGIIQEKDGELSCAFNIDLDFPEQVECYSLYFSFFKDLGNQKIDEIKKKSHDFIIYNNKETTREVKFPINEGDIYVDRILSIEHINRRTDKSRYLYKPSDILSLKVNALLNVNKAENIRWSYQIIPLYGYNKDNKKISAKNLPYTGLQIDLDISKDITDSDYVKQLQTTECMLVVFAYFKSAAYQVETKDRVLITHIAFPIYPAIMLKYKNNSLFLYKYGRRIDFGDKQELLVSKVFDSNASEIESEKLFTNSPYIISLENTVFDTEFKLNIFSSPQTNLLGKIKLQDSADMKILESSLTNLKNELQSNTALFVYKSKYPKITKQMLLQVFGDISDGNKLKILDDIVNELNRVYNGQPMYVHYKLDTRLRLEHFFAQCSVEASNLRTKEDFTYPANYLMYIDKNNEYATKSYFGNIQNVIKSNNHDYKKEWYDFISTHAYGRGIQKKDITDEHRKALANRIYSNKLGNGDVDSGDGWRYIGRGIKQLTGKNNYIDFGKYVRGEKIANMSQCADYKMFDLPNDISFIDENGIDRENNRKKLIENGKYALISAVYFWLISSYNNSGKYSDKNFKGMHLYEIADSSKNNTETVTVKVPKKVGEEIIKEPEEIDKYVLAISLVVNGGTNGIEMRNQNFKTIRKQGIFKEFDN